MTRRDELLSAISDAIVDQYLGDRRWVQFWPRQFVTQVSPEGEVVAALSELVRAGKMRAEVTLFCEGGHAAWTGSAAEASERYGHPCPDCDRPISDESVELQFIMTTSWRHDLEAVQASVQKKTPRAT